MVILNLMICLISKCTLGPYSEDSKEKWPTNKGTGSRKNGWKNSEGKGHGILTISTKSPPQVGQTRPCSSLYHSSRQG